MTPGFVVLFSSLVLILIALPWVFNGRRSTARAYKSRRMPSRL